MKLPRIASRAWIGLLSLVVLLVGGIVFHLVRSPGRKGSDKTRHPIVILLEICTLRKDFMGVYGDTRGLTPSMDAIAEKGIVFQDAISPSTWTKPSTASLLTGFSPIVTNIGLDSNPAARESGRLPDSLSPIAEIMANAGFRTVGLVGNPFGGRSFGFDAGFDEFNELGWEERGDILIERAIKLLREPRRRKPLFLFLLLADAHSPYVPYERDLSELPVLSEPDQTLYNHFFADWDSILRQWRRTDEKTPPENDIQRLVHRYAACIRGVDRLVGNLWEAIQENGLEEVTTLVIVSDHGESFWEDGESYGHGMNEFRPEVCEVPLIVRSPGFAPAVCNRVVSTMGVAPLLLSLSGAVPPMGLKPALLEALEPGMQVRSHAFCYTKDRVYLVGEERIGRLDLSMRQFDLFTREKIPIRREEDRFPERTASMLKAIETRLQDDLRMQVAFEKVDFGRLSPETQRHLHHLGYLNSEEKNRVINHLNGWEPGMLNTPTPTGVSE